MKAPLYKSVGVLPPKFTAGFDSGAGFVKALSNMLKGQDFKGLGVAPPLEPLADFINFLPRKIRETLYVSNTGAEGIPAEDMHKVKAEEFANAITQMYPQRKYPAIMIGSVSGAMVHLAAILGIPLLPQTFMIPVSRPEHLPLDEPKRTMEWALKPGEVFLKNNPYFKLHHMYDPSQDRLTLEKITYFRVKMLRLPIEYERFIVNNLQKDGVIIISDCARTWPVTSINDRFVFQFGALGGATEDDFHRGSNRVKRFLSEYNSHVRRWDAPPTDSDQPEAEWGYDRELSEDISRVALMNHYKIKNISFYEPEHPSPYVADLYRWWYKKKDVLTNRLVAETFFMHEPYWILKTGSVPFWLKFNMYPSADWLEEYLKTTFPFDEIYLMLFSHGVDAIGLAGIDRWERIMKRAKYKYDFIGVNTKNFPQDLGSMVKYNTEFKRKIPSRYNLQVSMSMNQLNEFDQQYQQSDFAGLIDIKSKTPDLIVSE